MKIGLTVEFLEKLQGLPNQVQNGIRRFLSGFPNNLRANGLNLERINVFIDRNLRTIRINKQYRAIIRVPVGKDKTYYLIWIDNHEEAINWGRNCKMDWNAESQTIQVYNVIDAKAKLDEKQTPKNNSGYKNPLEEVSDKQLIKIGVKKDLLPLVRKIKDTTDLKRIKDDIPNLVHENLLYIFGGYNIDILIKEIEAGRVEDTDFQAQKYSSNNRRSIFEFSKDEKAYNTIIGDFAAWRVFLHPSQRLLAEGNFPGSVKITGAAGTGKTVAALHRAKHLSNNGEGLVLFTTFTKSLISALEKDLLDLGANQSSLRITTLDSLVIRLSREFGLIVGRLGIVEFNGYNENALNLLKKIISESNLKETLSPEKLMQEYLNVILEYNCKTFEDYCKLQRIGQGYRLGKKQRSKIWSVLEDYEAELLKKGYKHSGKLFNELVHFLSNNRDKLPFRHIVADEIQDFGLIKLRMLRALAPEAPNDLFLVGDPLQKIYYGQTNFNKAKIGVRGMRSRKLIINYRTTEEIWRFALKPIMNLNFEDFDGRQVGKDCYVSLRYGPEPCYKIFNDKDQEFKWLIDKIRVITDEKNELSVLPSEIVVAVSKSKELKELVKVMHTSKIPYLELSGNNVNGDREGIVLSTMHNLKGHEYKIVFLMGISADTYPGHPSETKKLIKDELDEFNKQRAALLYVACSRAIFRLYLSGIGERCNLLDM